MLKFLSDMSIKWKSQENRTCLQNYTVLYSHKAFSQIKSGVNIEVPNQKQKLYSKFEHVTFLFLKSDLFIVVYRQVTHRLIDCSG